jgi:hypothetical protein
MLKLSSKIVYGALIFIIGYSGLSDEAKYFKTDQEYRDFLNKTMKFYYDYRITGDIVDPEGNPVINVKILSSKSTAIP